jgi:hypothetical protein
MGALHPDPVQIFQSIKWKHDLKNTRPIPCSGSHVELFSDVNDLRYHPVIVAMETPPNG